MPVKPKVKSLFSFFVQQLHKGVNNLRFENQNNLF